MSVLPGLSSNRKASTRASIQRSCSESILHFPRSDDLIQNCFPNFKNPLGVDLAELMGQKWKNHWHYVANSTSKGHNIYVHDLDDDEFNDLLDGFAFIYDPSRNALTKAVG